MADALDVLIKYLLDESDVKRGSDAAVKEMEKVAGAFPGDKLGQDFQRFQGNLKKTSEEVNKTIQKNEKVALSALQKEGVALQRLALLRSRELSLLKQRGDVLERGSKALFATGVSGFTAITVLAKKYIDTTEETNEVTKAWADSSDRVTRAQMRIGKISAEAILPLYEKLADIATKAADFTEKNPGVIEAGLKASIVMAGLGGIGILAAKGIKLYADVKMIGVGATQLAAAQLMSIAADKQLVAATGGMAYNAGMTGTIAKKALPGAAVAGSSVLSAAVIALALVIGAKIGEVGGQAIGKLIYGKEFEANLGNVAQTIYRIFAIPGEKLIERLHDVGLVSDQAAAGFSNIYTSIDNWIGTVTGAIAASEQYAKTTNDVANQQIQSSGNVARSAVQLSSTLSNVGNSANSTSQNLNRVPSALYNVANSIISFVQRLIGGISGSTRVPSHDYTGYAYTRTYAMAQDGKRQFVLSGDATRIAEQMLGGQLNQQAVLSALGTGRSSNSTQYIDNSRYAAGIGAREVRQIRQIARDEFARIIK